MVAFNMQMGQAEFGFVARIECRPPPKAKKAPPRLPAKTPRKIPPPSSRRHFIIDQELARYSAGPNTIEVYEMHESFKDPERDLTAAETRELRIKQTALRIASGMEFRSLRTLAKHIGCSHQAIDKALLQLCERIGIRKFHISDSYRRKLSQARQKFIDSKRA